MVLTFFIKRKKQHNITVVTQTYKTRKKKEHQKQAYEDTALPGAGSTR